MSFLSRYITNPVCLREIRRMMRLRLIPICMILILFVTFVLPGIWALNSLRPGAGDFHGNECIKAIGHLYWIFLLVVVCVASGFGLRMQNLGFIRKSQNPQKEFLYHGNLKPQMLMSGGRKTAWILLGLSYLATLPGIVFALCAGAGWVHCGIFLFGFFAHLLVSVYLIELALCSLGLGFAGFGALWTIPYITIFPTFFIWEWGDRFFVGGEVGFAPHLWYHLFGKKLSSHMTPVELAELPWGKLAGMIIFSLMILACLMAANRMRLKPKRTNREALYRLTLIATCVICMIGAGFYAWTAAGSVTDGPQIITDGDHTLGALLLCLFLSCELVRGWSETVAPLPERVRHEIPTTKWRRWLSFPFSYGPASKLVCCAGLIMTVGIAYAGLHEFLVAKGKSSGEHFRPEILVGMMFMILAWILQIAVVIQNNPGTSQEKLKDKVGKFSFVCICSLAIAIPLLVKFYDRHPKLNLEEASFSLPVGVILFLIQGWRSHKWFAERWREFQPAT